MIASGLTRFLDQNGNDDNDHDVAETMTTMTTIMTIVISLHLPDPAYPYINTTLPAALMYI